VEGRQTIGKYRKIAREKCDDGLSNHHKLLISISAIAAIEERAARRAQKKHSAGAAAVFAANLDLQKGSFQRVNQRRRKLQAV
jgi:hypothetical protein